MKKSFLILFFIGFIYISNFDQEKVNREKQALQSAKSTTQPSKKSPVHKEAQPLETGPKTAELTNNQYIKKKLIAILDDLNQGEMLPSEKSLSIARTYLKVPDGHIKKLALVLLSFGEISRQNFHSIRANILNYHDRPLISMALTELSRYKDERYYTQIHQDLIEVMQNGSLFSKNEIAKKSYMLITKDSYQDYLHLMDRLSPRTKTWKFIKASLDEFQLLANGG